MDATLAGLAMACLSVPGSRGRICWPPHKSYSARWQSSDIEPNDLPGLNEIYSDCDPGRDRLQTWPVI
jgi:hypothetical protein